MSAHFEDESTSPKLVATTVEKQQPREKNIDSQERCNFHLYAQEWSDCEQKRHQTRNWTHTTKRTREQKLKQHATQDRRRKLLIRL